MSVTLGRNVLCLLIFAGLAACKGPAPATNLRSQTTPPSEMDKRCLYIRQGTEVLPNTPAEETYASVGRLYIRTATSTDLCSSALLGPNVVLTAHHCVVDDDGTTVLAPDRFRFTLTGQNLEATGIRVIDNNQSPLRDIALVQTNISFPENIPYYSMKRGRITLPQGSPLTMVGYGGYTNGTDINSFSLGTKRIGSAQFQGYYNDDFFGSLADYIYLLPNNGQVICQGDSGSSLFQAAGVTQLVAGTASLGASEIPGDPPNPSQAQICHYAADGRYVPSDRFADWVQARMEEIDPHYKNRRAPEQILKATIARITPLAGMLQLDIATPTYFDQVQLGNIVQVMVCNGACTTTVVATPLQVGKEVMIFGELLNSGRLEARKITAPNAAYQYRTEFNGTVVADASAAKTVFGKTAYEVSLAEIAQPTDVTPIPMLNTNVNGTLCTAGCKLTASTNLLALFKTGNRLNLSVDVVNFQDVYIRDAKLLASPEPTPQATPTVNDCR